MLQSILKNWQTTVFGMALAGMMAIEPLISTGTVTWTDLIKAFLIAAFGFVAKDYNNKK